MLSILIIAIGSTVGIAVLLMIIVLVFIKPKRDAVDVVLFDRNSYFEFKKIPHVAGIASYGEGGFSLDEKAVMKYSYGSSVFEFGDAQNRRASKPIYLARVNDTAPMRFSDKGIDVLPISNREFNRREDLAAESGRTQAAKKLNGFQPEMGLLAIVVIMAIPLAIVALRVVLQ